MTSTVKRKLNSLFHSHGNGTQPSPSSQPGSTASNNAGPGGSNPSSPAPTSPASAMATSAMADRIEFLAKKRRVGVPPSTPPRHGALSQTERTPSHGTSNGTAHGSNVLAEWSPAGVERHKEPEPKYTPSDRNQLLRRLATFQELTDWTPKPERVSEIEWAKRGWVCQGKERVRCTLCNKELVVKLNRKEVDGKEVPVLVASEIEEALVERYVELMVTSHQEDCLWRKRGCDDSLLRLPLANAKAALEGLQQRYHELCARKAFVPYEFNLRLPEGLNIDTVFSYLPPDFLTLQCSETRTTTRAAETTATAATATTTITSPELNRPAFALALMGWQGLSDTRIGQVPNSASCHTCLRRLGLWMFKSKEVDVETSTVLVPAPMDHLDPLREHRFFCPWKSGSAQRNPATRLAKGEEDKAGWEVLVQALKNDSYLRSRSVAGRITAAAAAAAHGRSKSTNAPQSAPPTAVSTPVRPTTAGSAIGRRGGAGTPASTVGPGGEESGGEEDDEATRSTKDKERWARLRKVKSLFNTKASGKRRRTASRPGTGHSTIASAGTGAE